MNGLIYKKNSWQGAGMAWAESRKAKTVFAQKSHFLTNSYLDSHHLQGGMKFATQISPLLNLKYLNISDNLHSSEFEKRRGIFCVLMVYCALNDNAFKLLRSCLYLGIFLAKTKYNVYHFHSLAVIKTC